MCVLGWQGALSVNFTFAAQVQSAYRMICGKFSSDEFSRLRRLLEGLERRLQERLFQDTSSFRTSCNHWKDSADWFWTPWTTTISSPPSFLLLELKRHNPTTTAFLPLTIPLQHIFQISQKWFHAQKMLQKTEQSEKKCHYKLLKGPQPLLAFPLQRSPAKTAFPRKSLLLFTYKYMSYLPGKSTN